MSIHAPAVSIIVPVYNPGRYFPGCLESLEAQTVFDMVEVVLVDDGSTDGSGALCDDFAERHPGQVQVFHQPNQGLGHTRNVGIEAAHGDWILFVDSDDAIVPDACEQLLAIATKSGADLVWGEYTRRSVFFGEVARLAAKGPMEMQEFVLLSIQEGSFIISPCLSLYNRRFLDENGIRFARCGAWEDKQWLMRLLLCNPLVQRADCPFYIYNYGDHPSLSSTVTAKHLMDSIDTINASIDELEAADPPADVRKAAEAFIARSIGTVCTTYLDRASAQAREVVRLRLDARFAYYASLTQHLPRGFKRIGPAFVHSEKAFKEELARINEAKRRAHEAEEAAARAAANAETPGA